MVEIKINDTDYKVQFGFNQFIDTDLMDRVKSIIKIIKNVEDDKEITVDDASTITDEDLEYVMGRFDLIKEMFATTRELLFVGCQRHNPIENVYAAGDLMDDYTRDGGNVQVLFMLLVQDLVEGGFMGDLTLEGKGQPKPRKRTTKK